MDAWQTLSRSLVEAEVERLGLERALPNSCASVNGDRLPSASGLGFLLFLLVEGRDAWLEAVFEGGWSSEIAASTAMRCFTLRIPTAATPHASEMASRQQTRGARMGFTVSAQHAVNFGGVAVELQHRRAVDFGVFKSLPGLAYKPSL